LSSKRRVACPVGHKTLLTHLKVAGTVSGYVADVDELTSPASKHFYFTILPLAAQLTSAAIKCISIFGLNGAI